MAGRTIDEIITLGSEARQRIREAMSAASSGRRIDPNLAIKELDRVIAAQGERLEATRAAMARSASRFENEVRVRETRIAELRSLRERFEGREPVVPVEPEPPAPPAGPGGLRDIRGIGRVAEDRLRESGITTIRELSEAPPARIAEILDASEERATEFVREARLRLGRP
jgi:predicted flap endonuclease-1-like 5' DNA nuclease